ncbi:MAG: nucleoside kinase, partial [Muribaculaceae bacterium]|nr:nucleoside kinase [Muribaculaceae bacterium]
TVYYRLDGICDSYYGCLAPSTGMLDVFDLIPYKAGMLLLGRDPDNPGMPQKPVEQEKMFRAFTEYTEFNRVVGVGDVGELNDAVARRQSSMLINVAEALHDKKIGRISDDILRHYDEGGARIVMVAGPSSSGKTTFTKRLAIQLMTNLLTPKMISLDDYFVNREMSPRDESGDYDYESLYALDLKQFNADLQALLDGREVELPYYNFELGRREYRGNRIRLTDNSVLLIEGIHGLNPELTASIDQRMKYRIYVSALTTLSIDDHNWVPTTDNRLLRRIIRDYKYRGVSATETIRRWPSVRRGEEKWIFPYQENADAMFNSSLLFELGVMKEYGEEILKGVPRDVPEYAEAHRLRKFLSYFSPIGDRLIPPTSLLREFLGGSSFHY